MSGPTPTFSLLRPIRQTVAVRPCLVDKLAHGRTCICAASQLTMPVLRCCPLQGAPNPAAGGWMDNVRPVVSFNSVEEFWG